jgi:hypothetical protein
VLLRSLVDLEEAHATSALEDGTYERLRRQTEGSIASVLRAIDRRGRALPVATAGPRETTRVPGWVVALLLIATVVAVTVAGVSRNGGPVAGATMADDGDPLGFFEQRVWDHPHDLAARLDLGQRYLDAMRVKDALVQYRAALTIDPQDAEATAHVGLILFLADRPELGLTWVDRALRRSPDYPEARFIRGWILLDGLHRPGAAIASLQGYLDAAPFGGERANARSLIARARAEIAP